MEGYRSYPEGRSPYQEGLPPEPEYAEGANWYAERPHREPERYEAERYEPERYEPERYDERPPREFDEPRPDRPRPSPGEPARAQAPAPRSAPPPVDDLPPPVARRPPPPAVAPGSPGPPGPPGPPGEGVYRSKRPATAFLVAVPAALLEIPAIMLLIDSAFADPASPSGVVAASCLMLALPLLALGLHAVATGAVRAAGPNSIQAWLRPPVAYLSVALVLIVAAGLAA